MTRTELSNWKEQEVTKLLMGRIQNLKEDSQQVILDINFNVNDETGKRVAVHLGIIELADRLLNLEYEDLIEEEVDEGTSYDESSSS